MNSLTEILEQELEEAVEVKNKKSLHRYILLLVENLANREEVKTETLEIKSEIRILAETMKKGFEAVDKRFEDLIAQMNKRFEAVDKRFDDVNRRFTMMFSFITIGFVIITTITVLFKFLVV